MNPTEHLTRDERIQRIGQLLAKGATLLLIREAEEKHLEQTLNQGRASEKPSALSQEQAGAPSVAQPNSDERRILDYLARAGKAAPREMQCALEFSKATLFRRLTRLLECGWVIRVSGSH